MNQHLSPCEGCVNYKKCRDERLACREYAVVFKRGDNPNKRWFLYSDGQSIDHINRGISKKIKEGKDVNDVCCWLEDNFDQRIFHELTFPCEKRKDFLRHLRHYFPDEKSGFIEAT